MAIERVISKQPSTARMMPGEELRRAKRPLLPCRSALGVEFRSVLAQFSENESRAYECENHSRDESHEPGPEARGEHESGLIVASRDDLAFQLQAARARTSSNCLSKDSELAEGRFHRPSGVGTGWVSLDSKREYPQSVTAAKKPAATMTPPVMKGAIRRCHVSTSRFSFPPSRSLRTSSSAMRTSPEIGGESRQHRLLLESCSRN